MSDVGVASWGCRSGWKLLLAGALLGLLAACTATAPPAPPLPATYFVSTTGNDGASGDEAHPFASLGRARDAIRALKARQGLPAGGVRVEIAGGAYRLDQTLAFGPEDGGAPGAPIIYEAAPGQSVSLQGGRLLPASAFHPVMDPSILARLDAAALGHVLVVDLGSLGITDYGQHQMEGFWHPLLPSALELFLDGTPMTLARWPNAGEVSMAGVVDPGSTPRTGDTTNRGGTFSYSGDRPLRWKEPTEGWVRGWFHWPWADDCLRIAAVDTTARTLTLAAPHLYGLALGQPGLGYHVENLIEELDSPGEWYLDPTQGRLYFWPPTPLPGHEVAVSMLETPLVSIEGTSCLVFRNLTLEYGRGMGVFIGSGDNNRIEHCTLRDFGTVGVSIGQGILGPASVHYESTGTPWEGQVGDLVAHLYTNSAWDFGGGTDNGVVACQLYDLGGGGIVLGGGDRKTLTPGGNYAIDNDLHDVNRLAVSNHPALFIHGVGAYALHNRIHAVPQMAIYLQGNDHRVEFNEVFGVMTQGQDMGAIYLGRDPSERGNQIRWNYLHDIGNSTGPDTCGIYLDDGECGVQVEGNVFYRVGGGGQGAIFVNGGHEHRFENNIFIQCPVCVGLALWTDAEWLSHFGPGTLWERRLLQAVDIRVPPYSTRYPLLAGFYGAPQNTTTNLIDDNLAVACGLLHSGQEAWCTLGTNLMTSGDPGFLDAANEDWTLRPDATVFQAMPGFQAIPFHEIGPRQLPGPQP